ncbi:hypothetical protein FGADI_666 [Fusarium gaditjirri]|uniref:Uncharacterized protein n=1 Tax=Fusarium gaditjirri TaxID=282569 RepID=A0A8H4TMX3_9HYPO|nr:hypothetical protein FGADI_666 [Fusarium gaditjirri]
MHGGVRTWTVESSAESLTEWVTKLNDDTLFIQPNDEIAIKDIDDQVHSGLVIKINHNVYTYDQFKGGLLYVRGSTTAIQDEFSEILTWCRGCFE